MTLQEIEAQLWAAVETGLTEKEQILVAIDGRCASGKSSLAALLQEKHGCNVIHMDDFFLRPEQRTAERLSTPGGNVDYERFLQEVLLPLTDRRCLDENGPFQYGRFDCHQMAITDYVTLEPSEVTVIEGSYSGHPKLWAYYDLHVFLDVEAGEQYRRILARNPGAAQMFQDRWIPLEEKYFAAYRVQERCELRF